MWTLLFKALLISSALFSKPKFSNPSFFFSSKPSSSSRHLRHYHISVTSPTFG
ncbi:hypothetical protein HanRHA438_Chr01g0015171 [Helianthus annuus]|uniref:Uncharacterized protein n=1 Tax=Helianthus annuus TaxID=4232 RepID=A0A251VM26_HELAN|nr:hypothetical protein HanXRQr2_Chr01g0014761 [Helianthus annuus]KAJ0947433.1 hypothetical protein HanRHA438_Chr01g0015171 [Helianthus annuus]